MAVIVLVVHLVICVGLIALVLLQRSEGGALGMGGGGGGALMSGRGAADALAKMTQVAGGIFLATSLLLTVIQGAAQTSAERSVLDSAPSAFHWPNFGGQHSQPATPAPRPQSHDPLESAAPQAAPSQTAAAPITIAPAAASASERAGPVLASGSPLAPAAPAVTAHPAATPVAAPTPPRPAPAAATPARATTPAATTYSTAARTATATHTAASAAPASSGVASGVTVPVESTTDPLAPVRRDSRAGPDQ